jgi:glycosyltransferase involved in cell wall biosynthesis
LQPDVVIFSNALLSGAVRRLRERYDGPVYCTLQGDDVFLDGLPESHRERAIAAVAERAREFDGFFVHSRFYLEYMAKYLSLPQEKFRQIPLGIDLAGHDGAPDERGAELPFTIGYFARIAPEKGLHHLVDAFKIFQSKYPDVCLRAGGHLSAQDRGYFRDARQRLKAGGALDAFEYVGSPDTHEEKVAFYRSVDVLSVPTEFQEPKGLYVLESLANGRPVVQPNHGAFPELIEATGGGLLVAARDPRALADAWEQLLRDADQRRGLGAAGQKSVREKFNTGTMAEATLQILKAVG